MKTCNQCGLLLKDCSCRTTSRDETVRCQCGAMRRSKYMKSYGDTEICSNCLSIAGIKLSDLDYYKQLVNKFGIRLYDVQTNINAANKLGKSVEDYLAARPKSVEEFTSYFKGTGNEGVARMVADRFEGDSIKCHDKESNQ